MLDYQSVTIKPTTGYILWVISHGLHVTNVTTKYWEYLGKFGWDIYRNYLMTYQCSIGQNREFWVNQRTGWVVKD